MRKEYAYWKIIREYHSVGLGLGMVILLTLLSVWSQQYTLSFINKHHYPVYFTGRL